MKDYESGMITAATILCQLDYWHQAAEMLAESMITFDISNIDSFDYQYMEQLIERESSSLNGCLIKGH